MHQALCEMPGPRAEMTALIAHWDPARDAAADLQLRPRGAGLILGAGGAIERPRFARSAGLGGRSTPKPGEHRSRLEPGDRLVLVSDGVVERRARVRRGWGRTGLAAAAERGATSASAAGTVREIHRAVLAASGGELADDATAVCLLAG